MFKKEVMINNEVGLHARPASEFVKIAAKYKANVQLSCGSKCGSGKSIIHVMALNATKGSKLVIEAEGDDAKEAVAALAGYIDGGCQH